MNNEINKLINRLEKLTVDLERANNKLKIIVQENQRLKYILDNNPITPISNN